MPVHHLRPLAPALTLTLALTCTLSLPLQAAPLLRCAVTYAGSTQEVTASPTADPYSVTAVDIQGRFSFKAVMVGTPQAVDYIKLYVYHQTRLRDVHIHQATYFPPFHNPLTPQNHLYAGDVERELLYQCTLEGITP